MKKMKQYHQNCTFDATMQTNFTKDSLLTLRSQPQSWSPLFAPTVLLHVAEKLVKPSHKTWILQLAALPLQTLKFNF